MRRSMARGMRVTLGFFAVMSGAGAWLACSSSSHGGGGNAAADGTADAGAAGGSTNDAADGGAGEAAACAPQLSGTPSWSPSTGYPMNVCTSEAATTLVTDCIGATFDPAKCAADETTYAACYACGWTAFDQAPLGPLVVVNNLIGVNVAGCIGMTTGDTSASGCADAVGVALDCDWRTCIGCTHPLPDGGIGFVDGGFAGDVHAFNTCETESIADGGACATFASTAQSTCSVSSFGPCLQGNGEGVPAFLERILGYFCGPTLYDAGTAGGDDGGSDATSDAPPG